MKQYIEHIRNGEVVYSLNPEWQKKIQNEKYKHYLKESGIPTDYWNLEFHHAGKGANQRVVELCKNYIYRLKRKSKKNLYLYGLNSTGKTTAMCAIGKEAIREGFKVKFLQASNVLNLLQKTSGYGVDEFYETEKRKLDSYHLLLIDELFDSSKSILWKGESRNLIVAEWDSFLRHHLSNDRRIICTSNILMERIQTDYSVSLFELMDRNFQMLKFTESIKEDRKKHINEI